MGKNWAPGQISIRHQTNLLAAAAFETEDMIHPKVVSTKMLLKLYISHTERMFRHLLVFSSSLWGLTDQNQGVFKWAKGHGSSKAVRRAFQDNFYETFHPCAEAFVGLLGLELKSSIVVVSSMMVVEWSPDSDLSPCNPSLGRAINNRGDVPAMNTQRLKRGDRDIKLADLSSAYFRSLLSQMLSHYQRIGVRQVDDDALRMAQRQCLGGQPLRSVQPRTTKLMSLCSKLCG